MKNFWQDTNPAGLIIVGFKNKAFQIHQRARLLLILLTVLLASCSTTVSTTMVAATNAELSRDRARTNDLVRAHLEWVKALQSKGDPMGDYLWAEANESEHNWVENPIMDEKVITMMYIHAASKGSVDAQIVLGLRQFLAGSNPRRWDDKVVTEFSSRSAIMRDGLARLERATLKQCWYYKPYIFAPQNKRCLTPVIAAIEPWVAFRNGYLYPKDDVLRDYWKQKRDACEFSPEYQEALRKCRPFGG